MQRVNNMGSLLQAYALKKLIENNDITVEFMDIVSSDNEIDLLKNNTNHFEDEGETNSLVGKIKKIDRYLINRIKNKILLKKQYSLYDIFRKEYLCILNTSSRYDVCVIGSDEVFNCQDNAKWGFTSQLFGNISNADRVITYAASCGATEVSNVSNEVRGIISKAFRKIDYFSVRDKNTLKFVNILTDESQIHINLDPAFLYDFKNEMVKERIKKISKYCIVYSYYNRIHDKESITEIIKFCKQHGLTPIAIGAPQFWIKRFYTCTPFQCLNFFKNADFVITDTFHGTIFSVKYAKKYAIITRRSNNNKLLDLIERLGIDRHMISATNSLEEIYNSNSDNESVEYIRQKGLYEALEYLQLAIDG